MEEVARTTKVKRANPEKIIWLMPRPGIAKRLARALAETIHELGSGPFSYLRAALFPDRLREWFPIRLSSLVGTSIAHPVDIIRGAALRDEIGQKRRRRFLPVLSVSAAVHGVLVVYFVYLAFFSPFARLRIVDREYRKFNPDQVLAHLYYPPQILRQAQPGSTMTLEEIRERARKRREELEKAREKAEKEKAEKEKKEKEEAERKAAEEAKAAAANKPEPAKLTDINTAPIKDTVGKIYELYQAGGLDIADVKLSVMAGFKVEPDGSLSNIRIIKSSGSKIIDTKSLEILWNIGESHALGQVAVLSSATISLDITDDIARLRITAFAPTPEIAKEKATQLNALFWVLRLAQKSKSPEVAELLSMVRVSSRGKFVDTDLVVPREKAAQMMRTGFAKPGTPPQ